MIRGQEIGSGRPKTGFTVLELMVAISVLLVATLTALSSQVTSMNLMNTSRETNTAISDLQAAMEQLLLVPALELPEHEDFGHERIITAFDDLHLAGERIVVTYPGYDGATVPDPLPIVLTLNWNDYAGRPRDLSLRSMKVQ
jgi:prepilin-type N-terminal cleavage/methylation domain-containing protein